jgi:hypothetical protein
MSATARRSKPRRGPLLVLPDAGSGKTRVLTEHAAAVVANDGQRGELVEDFRLAYVGVNGARRELALSWPRVLGGRPARASRLLAEVGLGPAQLEPGLLRAG